MVSRKRSLDLSSPNSQDTDYDVSPVKFKEIKKDYSYRERQVLVPKELKSGGQQYLKIISWNVNGLRSLAITNRKCLLGLIDKHKPDFFCLQVRNSVQIGKPATIQSESMLLDMYRKRKFKTTRSVTTT
jgi:hypothetical protein